MTKFPETDVKLDLDGRVPQPPKFRRLKSNQEEHQDLIDYFDNVVDPMLNN